MKYYTLFEQYIQTNLQAPTCDKTAQIPLPMPAHVKRYTNSVANPFFKVIFNKLYGLYI